MIFNSYAFRKGFGMLYVTICTGHRLKNIIMKHLLLIILLSGFTFSTQAETWLIEKSNTIVIQDVRVTIYPNPATDRIYIRGNGAYHVELMNMIGEVVLHEDVTAGTVSIADLKSGMYIVRVYDAEGSLILSAKLTKQ